MSALQSSFSSPSSFLTRNPSTSTCDAISRPSATGQPLSPNGGPPRTLPNGGSITPIASVSDNNNEPLPGAASDHNGNANGGPDVVSFRQHRRSVPRPRPWTPSTTDAQGAGDPPQFVPLVCQYPASRSQFFSQQSQYAVS
uniref:Uncharacterized protein n=1 Tax=Panagrellus redivivus TaxID=6233 RepID=A0A7E4WBF5_PANRE